MPRRPVSTKLQRHRFATTAEREELVQRGSCKGEDSTIWTVDEVDLHHILTCRSCPVSEQCLEYALAAKEPIGVYNATSPTQRAAILRQRRKEARTA